MDLKGVTDRSILYKALEDNMSKTKTWSESVQFLEANYTKKQLLIMDEFIPSYYGSHWLKYDGVIHILAHYSQFYA